MKTRFTFSVLLPFSTFLILLLSSGNLQAQAPPFAWAHSFGDVGNDQGMMVTVDAAGNSYYVGSFVGTIDFDPGPGTFNLTSSASSFDIYILKLSPTGNLVWARSIGGTASDFGTSIALDASGNVNVIGQFSSTTLDFDPGPAVHEISNAGSSDLFLLRLDAAGNFLSALSWGSTGGEQGREIKLDAAGNLYITGNFFGTIDFDWGPGTTTLTSGGSGDIFVLKLDASGNFLWARRIGGTSSDMGMVLDIDGSGNVIVAGTFNGVVDFDPGPATFNLGGPGTDGFILKLDASGNFIWAGRIGGTISETPNTLETDASGNIYLGGRFGGTADFNPGPATHNITSAGSDDGFVLKLDAAGNFITVYQFGTAGIDRIQAVMPDAAGNLNILGSFSGTIDTDPGPGTANLTSAGSWDILMVKLDASGNFLWSAREGGAEAETTIRATMDAVGNIYAVGQSNTTVNLGGTDYPLVGGTDIFVVKWGDAITLPLHLTGFTAFQEKGSVQLKWTTVNEENVSHFIVERSLDRKNYVSLARVPAKNHSSGEYNYSDPITLYNTAYYRLSITDIDGSHSYSPVRPVQASSKGASVQLGPMPAQSILNINATGFTGRIQIQVLNSAGQLIKTSSMQAGNLHSLDISSLGKGNYFLRLTGAENYHSIHQFIKQ